MSVPQSLCGLATGKRSTADAKEAVRQGFEPSEVCPRLQPRCGCHHRTEASRPHSIETWRGPFVLYCVDAMHRGRLGRAVPDKWLDLTTGGAAGRKRLQTLHTRAVGSACLCDHVHRTVAATAPHWTSSADRINACAITHQVATLFAACKLFVDLVNRPALSAVDGASSCSDARRAPIRRRGESERAIGSPAALCFASFAGLSTCAHVISRGLFPSKMIVWPCKSLFPFVW